jgi:plastocyanin
MSVTPVRPDTLKGPLNRTGSPGSPVVVGVVADPVTSSATKSGAQAAPVASHNEDQGVVIAPTLATVDTTITIRAEGPELAFDPATITLKQGTRVRLRFVNMGTFAHNFILVRDDNALDDMIARAHDATENVPMSLKAKMVTWSNIANPTRTVETSFVVPAPGDYTYVCLVEGHANTMTGRLRSLP